MHPPKTQGLDTNTRPHGLEPPLVGCSAKTHHTSHISHHCSGSGSGSGICGHTTPTACENLTVNCPQWDRWRHLQEWDSISVDLIFPKSLEFTCHCMWGGCQSDGWWTCVPGLCFMKVKGPWGWSVKHIISVKVLVWMNQSFIIKHLWDDLEPVEASAHSSLTLWRLSSHISAIWGWN